MNRRALVLGLMATTFGLPQSLRAQPQSARPRLRLLVLGDSVTWGQGLLTPEKMQSLLAQRWSSTFDVRIVNYAHSGGVIGYDSQGVAQSGTPSPQPSEIPQPYPSMLQQLQAARTAYPGQAWDLVLLCGGINDINVTRIFNPFTSQKEIRNAVDLDCHRNLSKFLTVASQQFRATNPNVVIAALGYYTIVSPESHFPSYLSVYRSLARDATVNTRFGLVTKTSVPDDILQKALIANAEVFASTSRDAIKLAVDEANRSSGQATSPNVFFVDPMIGDDNAAMTTPKPEVWGLDENSDPQDPLAQTRKGMCDALHRQDLSRYVCLRASVGHPNIDGAQRYADAIDATVGPVLRERLQSSSTPAPEGSPAAASPTSSLAPTPIPAPS